MENFTEELQKSPSSLDTIASNCAAAQPMTNFDDLLTAAMAGANSDDLPNASEFVLKREEVKRKDINDQLTSFQAGRQTTSHRMQTRSISRAEKDDEGSNQFEAGMNPPKKSARVGSRSRGRKAKRPSSRGKKRRDQVADLVKRVLKRLLVVAQRAESDNYLLQ